MSTEHWLNDKWQEKTKMFREEPVPMPIHPPWILHQIPWDSAWVSMLRIQRKATWIVTLPTHILGNSNVLMSSIFHSPINNGFPIAHGDYHTKMFPHKLDPYTQAHTNIYMYMLLKQNEYFFVSDKQPRKQSTEMVQPYWMKDGGKIMDNMSLWSPWGRGSGGWGRGGRGWIRMKRGKKFACYWKTET